MTEATLKGVSRAEFLRRFLYDTETGDLHHRLAGDGRRTDRPVGTVSHFGYLVFRLSAGTFLNHRVVWFMETGEIPDTIDHINGNRADNRLSNLRPCSQAQNVRNAARRSDNTSGWKGVTFEKRRGKWAASVQVGGRKYGCGYYGDVREAAEARMFAALALHGDFARLA